MQVDAGDTAKADSWVLMHQSISSSSTTDWGPGKYDQVTLALIIKKFLPISAILNTTDLIVFVFGKDLTIPSPAIFDFWMVF